MLTSPSNQKTRLRRGIFWLGIAIALLSEFNLSAQITNCVTAPSGIISWWPGDGDATDFVGGANGFYSQYTTGMVGQAFNVATAFSLAISNRASLNPTNGITIEAWVLAWGGGAGKSFYVVSKDGDTSDRQYILSIGPSGKFRAHIGVPNLVYFDGQTAVQQNTWYHVAMTYDRTALNLYVNGTLEGSVAATGPIIVTSQPLRIGGGGFSGYNGLVDEPTLYDRALSISEIQAIYQANAAGKCKIPFPPKITSEPLGQTVTAGSKTLFSVETKGTPPLFYQWSRDGTNLMGATTTSFALTNIQARDAGTYTVLVTNIAGSVTSAPANLGVIATIPIVQTGPSNRNAIGETPVSLSVSASGTEFLGYQWQMYGTNLPGSTVSLSPIRSVQSPVA
jgi:hypothetical protein